MGSIDMSLLDFPTYNDYIDSFSLPADYRYLRNSKFCRTIVKIGYRSNTDILTEEQFETAKAIALENLNPMIKSGTLFSHNLKSKDPVLRQLAIREKPNVQKTISTIIFLKVRRKSGFEISGYIDFEQSLRMANRKADNCVDWLGVFQEEVMLKPSPSNLSFFDWKRGTAKFNNTDNYIIVHDVNDGLIFMHRGDHKQICVNRTKKAYSKNFSTSVFYSEVYGYVIFYDHVVRKKI